MSCNFDRQSIDVYAFMWSRCCLFLPCVCSSSLALLGVGFSVSAVSEVAAKLSDFAAMSRPPSSAFSLHAVSTCVLLARWFFKSFEKTSDQSFVSSVFAVSVFAVALSVLPVIFHSAQSLNVGLPRIIIVSRNPVSLQEKAAATRGNYGPQTQTGKPEHKDADWRQERDCWSYQGCH